MDSKHTPGPWHRGWRACDIVAGKRPIATVNFPSAHPATETVSEANARLIAAAPELLAALREISTYMDTRPALTADTPDTLRVWTMVQTAIAKAEGE